MTRESDATISPGEDVGTRQTLKRRGILAAAGAVVAGIVAKQAAQPVAADGTLTIPSTNTASAATNINAAATFNSTYLFKFDASPITSSTSVFTHGLQVTARGAGGQGVVATGGTISPSGPPTATGGDGVHGVGGDTNSGAGGNGLSGVGGSSNVHQGGYGVRGDAGQGFQPTSGVLGFNSRSVVGSIGVRGTIPNTVGATGTIGVLGEDLSTGTGGAGVKGTSDKGNGVFGSTGGSGVVAGIYGTSTTAYGVIGSTTATGFSGLTAINNTSGIAALAATTLNSGGFAAYFSGFTYVDGTLAVSGGKAAAAMHPDGTRRLLHCVEAPEAWFEDFGEAKYTNGRAEVKIDAEFAGLIRTDTYHVFLTGHDEQSEALVVAQRRPDGFTVKERKGGASSGTFSWRIVARRKDFPGKRLEKFTPIKLNIPDPAKLPQPEPTAKP